MIHYWWKVKLDVTNPMIYAAIVGALLSVRVWRAIQKRQTAHAAGHHSPRASSLGSR